MKLVGRRFKDFHGTIAAFHLQMHRANTGYPQNYMEQNVRPGWRPYRQAQEITQLLFLGAQWSASNAGGTRCIGKMEFYTL